MSYRLLASTGLGALLLSALAPAAGSAAPLAEPPVFASQGGALDLVMVAKPLQITLDQGVTPTAWVYDVCQRADPSQNDCKDGTHPLSCSPFQVAGTEIPCLFVQAVQRGRHWAKQEARS
jgi:hypothetical protein